MYIYYIYAWFCDRITKSHTRITRIMRGQVFSKHAWGIDLEISWDLFLLPSIKWLNPIPHVFWWKSGIPLSFGEIAGSSFQEEEQENAFTRDDESAVSSSSAISHGISYGISYGILMMASAQFPAFCTPKDIKRLDDCHLGFWKSSKILSEIYSSGKSSSFLLGNPWIFWYSHWRQLRIFRSHGFSYCQAGEPLACTSPIRCAQRRGRGGK